MANFKAVVRKKRADGFYPAYIRIVHRSRMGYIKTSKIVTPRNQIKYFLQLLGFAVISEVPWYLLNGADGTHNVLFTLALGVMALAAFETLKKDGILCGAVILSIASFATWLGVDYEWRGILMMLVFYLLGNISKPSFPSGRKAQLFCAFPLMMHYGIIGALLACLTIACYDGMRGFIHGKVAKYGFYAFYPVHLGFFFFIQ